MTKLSENNPKYDEKDLSVTSDSERLPKSQSEKLYVIQRHEATRLHWDLRLEMDGVLRSWALPKEPPRKYGVKRLAVQVEDHSIEYADFQGVIPEGIYGAGEVEMWDKGTYDALIVQEDKIEIVIHGEQLSGLYVLIRTKWRGKGKNWLFFKSKKIDFPQNKAISANLNV